MKHKRLPCPRILQLVSRTSPIPMPEMRIAYETEDLMLRRSLGHLLTKQRARELSEWSSLPGQKIRVLLTRDGLFRMMN